MLEIIMVSILTFCVAIGLAIAIREIILSLYGEEEKKIRNIPNIVFYVKRKDQDIEPLLRMVLWRLKFEDSIYNDFKIAVVDFSMDEETFLILKKLEQEYGCLTVYDKKAYINEIEKQA